MKMQKNKRLILSWDMISSNSLKIKYISNSSALMYSWENSGLFTCNTNIVSINFLGIHHLKSTGKIFYISEYWTQLHKFEINEFRWTVLIHRWFVNYLMSFHVRSCYGIKKMLLLADAQLASWEFGSNRQMHDTSNFQRIHFIV